MNKEHSSAYLALLEVVKAFSEVEEVECIVLAGSYASDSEDGASDFDVYVYSKQEVPLDKRKRISDKFFSYMELNNQYWETEDDGLLREKDMPVDIVYRSLEWMNEQMENLLVHHRASTGFTTCFWYNLMHSVILFDRTSAMEALKKRYDMPYPAKLKYNIIKVNRELLKGKLPSYYDQISKAVDRDDIVSINHRIAAFLASYFDILFAVNERMHPGEKKLVKLVIETLSKIPVNFKEDITELLALSGRSSKQILTVLDRLIGNLDKLLNLEGYTHLMN